MSFFKISQINASESNRPIKLSESDQVFKITVDRGDGSKETGTGFLYASNKILTAAHVIENARPASISASNDFRDLFFSKVEILPGCDLAILTTINNVDHGGLSIAQDNLTKAGSKLVIWAYPGNSPATAPLYYEGYLSGEIPDSDGRNFTRHQIICPIDSGCSGAPVIDQHTGLVVGLLATKSLPSSPMLMDRLKFLKDTQAGLAYGDGSTFITQNSIIADAISELREHSVLGIGQAIGVDEIRDFLGKLGYK